ncbi:MAG: hypothetical protein EHM47_03445 [Ignavibacteriales bacterium]|nr:MAG: hypothetical protein EHM47_03445 [Ignavibacteriales bacterium]
MIYKIFFSGSFVFFTLLFTAGCVQPESINSSTAGNSNPEIKSMFADPLFVKVGATAQIKVEAEDPDLDPLSYEWTTAIGDIIGSGSEVRYSAAYCCAGINIITVTVADNKGAKTSKSIEVEIVF